MGPANIENGRPALEHYPQERFDENLPQWRGLVESGKRSASQVLAMVSSKANLSEAQKKAILDLENTETAQ